MNWWPIIISGGIFLLVNITIIIGYIKNHSKHIKEAVEKMSGRIDKLVDEVHDNATDIATIQGRLNSQK